jgi:E3 ubiquitin-protein ligase HUWE1
MLPLLIEAEEQDINVNRSFRNLVTLHNRITLLSDVFATAGYAHGRAAIGLLQTLMSNTSTQVVTDLGTLHRAIIWENIVLKAGLSAAGIDVTQTPQTSPLDRSPDQAPLPLPEGDGAAAVPPSLPNVLNGATDNDAQAEAVSAVTPPPKEAQKSEGPRERNAAALKHLTRGLPGSLAPFFQGRLSHYLPQSC